MSKLPGYYIGINLDIYNGKKLEVDLTQAGSPQLQDLGLNCLPLLPQCRVIAFATQCSNTAWYIITAQTIAHSAQIYFKVQLITHEYSLSSTPFWYTKWMICKVSLCARSLQGGLPSRLQLVWFPEPSCMGGAREGREGRVWWIAQPQRRSTAAEVH